MYGQNTTSFSSAAVVTKSDSTFINFTALFVGGAGNVAVALQDGTVVTFTGVLAGTILPIAGSKVMSTNTTATNMVAMN